MKRLPFMRIATCLLAGAVVTYVVAFLALSTTPNLTPIAKLLAAVPREARDVTPSEIEPPVYAHRGRTLVKTYWQFMPTDDVNGYVGHLNHIGFPFRATSVLVIGVPRTSAARPSVSRIQRGLPLTGMPLRVWNSIFPYPVNVTYDNPCLPLRLLPLGFIADTAIYALLLFGLMHLFRWVRQRRRARRSLCTCCKYPVRNLATCPECGTAVPAARSAAH